ncbi:MAG: PEP-CTERM sorting domain-containing protein, partial [Pirellulaceae bacterium]
GNLLFGLQMNGAWDVAPIDSANKSALPGAIGAATANVFITPEVDNAQYTGTRTFLNSAALLAAVSDETNWTGSNSAIMLDGSSFQFIPEPSSLLLFGSIASVLAYRRRR